MLTEELVPLLNVRAGLPQGTELALFEEIKPNLVERLADLDRPLEKVSLPLCILMLNYVKGYQNWQHWETKCFRNEEQ